VEKFATTVKEGPILYNPSPSCSLELKEKLETSHLKVYNICSLNMIQNMTLSYYVSECLKNILFFFVQFDASLRRLQELGKDSFLNMDNKFETYQKRLSIDYREILHCLDNLGLICAHLVFFYQFSFYYQFIICLLIVTFFSR